MRSLRAWLVRVSSLAVWRRRDGDLDAELASHIHLHIDDQVRAGISPAEARRAALVKFGGVEQIKEEYRDRRGLPFLETLGRDVRYAARVLRAAPGFTGIVVLTLALGIGGTTAIFSAVKPILFTPLPYPNPDRIMTIWETHANGSRSDGTFGMFRWLADRSRSFEVLALMKTWPAAITGVDEPQRLSGQRVSAQYFHVLGVAPAIGRDFEAADDVANGPNVVILSDALWRRHFAADPAIVGHAITLDDTSFMVIGVMPKTFTNVTAPVAELWAPLQYALTQGRAWGHHLRTIGRLRAGAGAAEAARETKALGQSALDALHPETYGTDVSLVTNALGDDVTRGVKATLLAILGAVTLVLAIACVNVTNLMLARGVHRRGEFALRVALGAGHGRVVRQLLTESLLLTTLGGVAGMAVATAGVRALIAIGPSGLPRLDAIHVDGAVFAFGVAITMIIGLAVGFVPALQAARRDPQQNLRHGSRRTAGAHGRTRGALVVVEVALALVLLVGSGLLFHSLQRLFAIDAGFDAAGVLSMQVQTIGRKFDTAGTASAFFEHALEAVRRVPGVQSAALTSQLPMSGDRDGYGVFFEATPDNAYGSYRYGVSPAYIETMRIPKRAGRLFDENDRAGAERVAIISESIARQQFQSRSPIGQRLRIGPKDGPLYTVVGVVADLKQVALTVDEPDAVYIPATQWFQEDRTMSLVVRARGDASALAPSVRRAIWSVDKDQLVVRVAMMDDLVSATAAERRFALMLFEAFGIAALVLATAGIYGVLAAGVAERTREIGVRAALGASKRAIVTLVVRQGVTLTGLGIVIGLIGAVPASRALVSLLFGVSRLDPMTYAVVVVLMLTVAILACAVPAWRAARIDPATTLRAE